jgi:hypothetical protein
MSATWTTKTRAEQMDKLAYELIDLLCAQNVEGNKATSSLSIIAIGLRGLISTTPMLEGPAAEEARS